MVIVYLRHCPHTINKSINKIIDVLFSCYSTTPNDSGLSLMAQLVKKLPAMWETWVQSLGQEGPQEKEMAIHSSILAWEILWTEGPGGLIHGDHRESDMTEQLST